MKVMPILKEISTLEKFLKRHKKYLGDDYYKYQNSVDELKLKVKLKEIEHNIKLALEFKSNKNYAKSRDLLKKSSKDLDKLEDKLIKLNIKTLNTQISNLKNQINHETNDIRNLILNYNDVNPEYSNKFENNQYGINDNTDTIMDDIDNINNRVNNRNNTGNTGKDINKNQGGVNTNNIHANNINMNDMDINNKNEPRINKLTSEHNIDENDISEVLVKLKKLLSKYQNPVKIGEGGFSYVFRAVKNGKTIALKVPKELTEVTGEIFLREIENWKKLKHINIVKLYYSNIYPYPYIEMEYCEKELEKIKNNLNLKDSVMLIFEVLNGLKYAHDNGIIHKDLKPSNILISNNIPKITDWGLSKSVDSDSTIINALTLQYSAPEQISGGSIDKRTDIYQMGIILYELTTKKLPFKNNNFKIMQDIENKMPTEPFELNPIIDKELNDIIMKCIQKDKSKRYQSVRELQSDLATYLDIQLMDKFTSSKTNNDFSRSVFYCSDLILFHVLNNDLKGALNYLYDLKYYADKYCSSEVISAIDNLINAIEYRVKENITEPSDDIKMKTKIVVDKVKLRF